MTSWRIVGLVLAGSLAAAGTAHGQGAPAGPRYELTLAATLTLARKNAPVARLARARVEEARGRLTGASVLLRHNPSLEVGGGPRFGPDGVGVDLDVGLGLTLEPGRRGARMAAATAGVELARAASGDATRRVLRRVARAFLRARYAVERQAIAEEAARVAAEVHRVARTRHQAGEVGVLDENLAGLALARARAEAHTAAADQVRALGALAVLLGLKPGARLVLKGPLLERRKHGRDRLLAAVAGRSDLRALDAARKQAGAQARLARSQAWPELGLRLGYGREEQAHMALASLSLSLPLFNRAQGPRAVAQARGQRLGLERATAGDVARAKIITAHRIYQRLLKAVTQFEIRGLKGLSRTREMARKKYQAGDMPLTGLLAVRRELVGARMAHAGLLLRAALALVELEAEAGVLR